MGQSPDELRREIESLRDDLSTLVEAVGERVSPKKVVRRSANSVGSTVRSVRGSVMGTAEDAADTLRTKTRRTTAEARRKMSGAGGRSSPSTRGRSGRAGSGQSNRAAAGMVALGAGMLAASLLPPSETETRALEDLKGSAARMRDELAETGRSVVDGLRPELEQSKDVLVARGQRSGARVARSVGTSGRKVQSKAKTGAQRTKTQAKSSARGAS